MSYFQRVAVASNRIEPVPVDLPDTLRIVRRRWLLILSCLLIAVAAAAVVTIRATPQYASTARLFVSTPGSGSVDAYQGGLFSQQRVTSYADLIKGKEVAQRVIERLDLSESAADLAGKVTSLVAPQTVIIEVSVTDPDPQRAELLAQTVAEEFTKFVGELETAPGETTALIKATVVEPAGLPGSPVSPQPLRNLGLGVILGLLVGIGVAVARERLDTTLRSPDALKKATGGSLLGTVGFDPGAGKRPLVSQLDSHAPRIEAFRILRTNLQFVDVDEAFKVFVVSSPLPGDGKSTTAINLALMLAQAGERVVLVEADLRRPRVSDYLRLESAVGLTTLLIGRVDLADAVQQSGQAGLDVITSGAIPPNPAELLQSKAMAALLAELRGAYDLVIIDAPPLLPVTDAALIAAQSDGVILVVRHGKTTKDQCEQAVDRLRSVGAPLSGSVLNMVPSGPETYGYRYGYEPLPKRLRPSRRESPMEPSAVAAGVPIESRPAPTAAGRPVADADSATRMSQDTAGRSAQESPQHPSVTGGARRTQ